VRVVLILLAIMLVGVATALGVAHLRWRAGVAAMNVTLGCESPDTIPAVRWNGIGGVPRPVRRYLRAVLRDGQPVHRCRRLTQAGEFLVEGKGWRPFTATQHMALRPPGFVWDARIRMAPGLTMRVRDAFVDGRGSMLGSMLGLAPIVDVAGTPGIDAGALHRYLAEGAWMPTALLPAQGVVWAAIDDTSARATLTVGSTTVSLDVYFGRDGLITRVFTPARARDVGGRAVPTPWEGRFSEYEERDGMLIPIAGEVAWILPQGRQPYWRGRITGVTHESPSRRGP
jgi:hypothetical protein